MALRDVIAKLSIAIGTDTRGLESGMKKGRSELQEFGRAAGRVATAASAAFAAIGAAALTAASAAAEYADEIDKMSISTGLSRESLQKLKYVSDQTGVEFSTISENVSRLTRAMGEADRGGQRQVEAFQKLGLTIYDTSGNLKSLEVMFPEVITALGKMQQETERNALAMDVFGESASKMVPRLTVLGEEGFQQLTDKAKELNMVMSEKSVAALVAYKDGMSTLGQQVGAILRTGIMPFVEVMNERLIPSISKGLRKISELTDRSVIEIQKEKAELNSLVTVITHHATSTQARERAIKTLNDKYPDFLKNMDQEKMTSEEIKNRLIDINRLYDQKIKLAISEQLYKKNSSEIADLAYEETDLIKRLAVAEAQRERANQSILQSGSATQGEMDAFQMAANNVELWTGKLEKNREKQEQLQKAIVDTIQRINDQGQALEDLITSTGYNPNPDKPVVTTNNGSSVVAVTKPELPGMSKGIEFGPGVSVEGFETMETSIHRLAETLGGVKPVFLEFSETVQASFQDMAAGFGEAIGNMISGTGDMGGVFNVILEGFGSFAQKMGKLIIAWGFSNIAFKQAWSNPYAAIAAGTALVALGAVIRNAAQNPDVSSGGASMASASYATSMNNQPSTQRIELVWKRAGKDLVAILAAETRSRNTILAN